MTEINSNNNKTSELEQLSLKLKKLIWTWLIGLPVLILCVVYGDTAQLVLAGFIVIYLFFTTKSYLNYVSSIDS
jgi:hypothetical protein